MVSMYGIGHMTANRIGIQDVNPKSIECKRLGLRIVLNCSSAPIVTVLLWAYQRRRNPPGGELQFFQR